MSVLDIILAGLLFLMVSSYVYMNIKYPYKYGGYASRMTIKRREQMKIKEWVNNVGQENIRRILEFNEGWIVLKELNKDLAQAYKEEVGNGTRTGSESK